IIYITNKIRTEVLYIFISIKRSNFGSINSFFNQYTKFYKYIYNTKYEFTNNIKIGYLYNAIKNTYPIDAKY
ncbi:hypothetical protein QBC32DRAFT_225996, partial [Pseudoneurospora amorphoporcata]